MSSSHSLDAIAVTFDDEHLVADAGLIQPATLAQHLGLRELFNARVDLGHAAGRANVGDKAMTVIHSALAGGDSIDDCDALRAGATGGVLGHVGPRPPARSSVLREIRTCLIPSLFRGGVCGCRSVGLSVEARWLTPDPPMSRLSER